MPALLMGIVWVVTGSSVLAESELRVPDGGLRPGAIGLFYDETPAAFSFEHSQGRVESASEGAAYAARTVLNTPDLAHSWLTAGAGIVGFAVAPIAAGYGALHSARQRLPEDKLIETEAELSDAMRASAAQQFLHALLLQATNEMRRPVIAITQTPVGQAQEGVRAMLYARIEQLRLEKADTHDRFILRIAARARLVATSEAAPIFERHYEFLSGKALFVDWAGQGGFESVARTGYQDITERIARDVADCSATRPMLLGAGYYTQRSKDSDFLPLNLNPPEQPMLALISFPESSLGLVAARGALHLSSVRSAERQHLATVAPTRLAEYQADGLSFEIEANTKTDFRLQLPTTKQEALGEAASDTEWALGGLENDRNFVVQTGAAIAAIPLGLVEQSKALWHGLTAHRLAKAKASLEAVARSRPPQEAVALEVVRGLGAGDTHRALPVVAVTQTKIRRHADRVECASGPVSHGAAIAEQGETVLEIRVLSAGLSGDEGINPRLALKVEVLARVIRAADGTELYSLAVFYRGSEKRFCGWAAHEALGFRQELDSCYRQLGRALATSLAGQGLAPVSHTSVLASN